jgi:hypothetical protein
LKKRPVKGGNSEKAMGAAMGMEWAELQVVVGML